MIEARRWFALAALVVCVFLGFGCTQRERDLTADDSPSGSPNEGMRGIELQNFRVGATRWVLYADTASVYRNKKRIEAEDIRVEFFEEERHVSTLTAERGILLRKTDDLEARGNVVVESTDGAVLETEVLFWNHKESKIHTEDYVEITQDGNVLTGVGLEADPGLDRVDIKSNVRGQVTNAPEELQEEATP